jgi:hypothetical protein
MGRKKGSWHGEANPNWQGGIRHDSNGRVYLLLPSHPNSSKNGYVRKSVLIMSEHLQRPIASNEIIHHINGDARDDRLENLVMLTRASHTSFHHKGLIKPNSLKNLTHRFTSDTAKKYWDTEGKNHRRKKLTCERCGKIYLPNYRGQTRNNHHYCSKSCAAKVNFLLKTRLKGRFQTRPL